jgi:hypothetical protein
MSRLPVFITIVVALILFLLAYFSDIETWIIIIMMIAIAVSNLLE